MVGTAQGSRPARASRNLRQFMERVFPIFARIRTTEQAIGMMRQGAAAVQ